MPLIDPQPHIPREKVAFRLQQSTMALLRLYAEWINSTYEWVVDRALQYFFARDKDFQKMLASRNAAPGTRPSPDEIARNSEAES